MEGGFTYTKTAYILGVKHFMYFLKSTCPRAKGDRGSTCNSSLSSVPQILLPRNPGDPKICLEKLKSHRTTE